MDNCTLPDPRGISRWLYALLLVFTLQSSVQQDATLPTILPTFTTTQQTGTYQGPTMPPTLSATQQTGTSLRTKLPPTLPTTQQQTGTSLGTKLPPTLPTTQQQTGTSLGTKTLPTTQQQTGTSLGTEIPPTLPATQQQTGTYQTLLQTETTMASDTESSIKVSVTEQPEDFLPENLIMISLLLVACIIVCIVVPACWRLRKQGKFVGLWQRNKRQEQPPQWMSKRGNKCPAICVNRPQNDYNVQQQNSGYSAQTETHEIGAQTSNSTFLSAISSQIHESHVQSVWSSEQPFQVTLAGLEEGLLYSIDVDNKEIRTYKPAVTRVSAPPSEEFSSEDEKVLSYNQPRNVVPRRAKERTREATSKHATRTEQRKSRWRKRKRKKKERDMVSKRGKKRRKKSTAEHATKTEQKPRQQQKRQEIIDTESSHSTESYQSKSLTHDTYAAVSPDEDEIKIASSTESGILHVEESQEALPDCEPSSGTSDEEKIVFL